MKRDVLNLPNLLSLFRLLLAVPFVLVTVSSLPNARFWGIVILVVGIATDKLDGMIARRRHQETEWGRIIDPVADKIGVAAVAVALTVIGIIPMWFLVVIAVRDLLILCGGIYLKSRKKIVVPSNTAGKWTVTVVSLTLLGGLLALPPEVLNGMMILSMVMLIASFTLYVKLFVHIVRG